MGGGLGIHVLGPFEVERDGRPIALGSFKQRSLLAILVIHRNQVVSTDRLIDELWGGADGHDHQNALWAHVSNLRKALEPDADDRTTGVVTTTSPGYVLRLDDEALDAAVFEHRVAEGRALVDIDAAAASIVLGEALAMWRGPPLEDFAYESWAQPEIARLDELRLEAVELRVAAELRAGRRGELVAELESLVRQHPTRESLTASLMLALHGAGRTAEALRQFRSLEGRLGSELGIRPSTRLQRLHDQVAVGDPSLDRADGASTIGSSGPTVRGYEVRERIGEWGAGVVYRAYQPALGREVAVRIVRPELADDARFIRRFEAEARTVARLEHPNIVPVYDFWREPGAAYVVTRLVGGGTLCDLLADGWALAPDALSRLVDQIGAAIETAHRNGVAHGDVSADHILVDERGDMYLTDFAIAAPPTPCGPGADVRAFAAVVACAAGTDPAPEVATALHEALAESESDLDITTFRRELSKILQDAEQPVITTSTSTTENPYRGLRSFEQSDAEYFFGRDRFVERLVDRVRCDDTTGSFVAVVGPSGSGKSSVVKAGLLPALRAGAVEGSERWFIVEMTPKVHPFEELEDALLAVAVHPPPSLLEALTGEHGIQQAVVRVLPDADDACLVLVVDQLEELFTLAPADAAVRFMDALTDVVEVAPHRIKVVVTLRADYFDRPLRHHGLGGLLRRGTEVLTPMTPVELERAITAPARRAGARCDPGLVSELIAAMADQPSALPLLEYALTELFDRRSDDGVLGCDQYRGLGGLSGALVGRAESIHHDLSADQQVAAEQIFLRLVNLDDGRMTRRRVPLGELQAMSGIGRRVSSIVESFAHHRLLTLDRDLVSRATTVEISHETLLTAWPRLARWLDRARADVEAQRRLGQFTGEWIERNRNEDFVLREARLARYAGWIERPPVAITADEREFLLASTSAAEDRERRRRHQLERDSRLRRRSALLVGLAAVTAVVLALAVFAVVQQRRAGDLADQIAASDEARRLGGEAQILTRTDPGLAMIAAIESARVTAPYGEVLPETVDALYAAFGAARVQYPFASAPIAMRPAAGGGVFLLPPDDLIELVQEHVPVGIPDDRCRELGIASCAAARDPFPEGLQIAGGATAYAGDPSDAPLAGTTVRLVSPQAGDALTALQGSFDSFTQRTGIAVSARANRGDELPADHIHGDTTTDLLVVPQPGVLAQAAHDGPMDLTLYLERDDLDAAWGPYLTSLVSVDADGGWPSADGPVYGIWNKLDLKSLLWHDPAHFDDAGLTSPRTWDETIGLSDRILDAGATPWCMGIAAGGNDDGWPATDVLEAIVLRQHGPEVYDDWWSHRIPFDDPRIIESARTMGQIVFTTGYLSGGSPVAARTSWAEGPFALAEDPPGCRLIAQASFVSVSGPEQLAPLDFPVIAPEFSSARVGGGTFVVAVSDRPEVRAVVEYMASPEFGQVTAETGTGFIPPHTGVDLELIVDDVERTMAELTHDALLADQFRFDASDMMPRQIGADLMWQAMIEWFDQGPGETERIFAEVEDAWSALEAARSD